MCMCGVGDFRYSPYVDDIKWIPNEHTKETYLKKFNVWKPCTAGVHSTSNLQLLPVGSSDKMGARL